VHEKNNCIIQIEDVREEEYEPNSDHGKEQSKPALIENL